MKVHLKKIKLFWQLAHILADVLDTGHWLLATSTQTNNYSFKDKGCRNETVAVAPGRRAVGSRELITAAAYRYYTIHDRINLKHYSIQSTRLLSLFMLSNFK